MKTKTGLKKTYDNISGTIKVSSFKHYVYHKKFIYAEANDPELIKNGFNMTRKIEDIIELYEHLTQNGTVDIKSIKDSKKRDNITSKPDDDGTLRSTERLPVLHTRINLLKVRKSQKAIFRETPLPKTQTKNQKDFCPVVILEGRAEILQIFCLFLGKWSCK